MEWNGIDVNAEGIFLDNIEMDTEVVLIDEVGMKKEGCWWIILEQLVGMDI